MEPDKCPKVEKCPIFSGVLKGTKYTETYKKLYCLAGEEGRNNCKRFEVSQKFGVCPDKLLPNSTKSMIIIEEELKDSGLIK